LLVYLPYHRVPVCISPGFPWDNWLLGRSFLPPACGGHLLRGSLGERAVGVKARPMWSPPDRPMWSRGLAVPRSGRSWKPRSELRTAQG